MNPAPSKARGITKEGAGVKVGGIIQARMTSSRFPGKVMRKIDGKPMLGYLLERMAHCSSLDGVVVATSSEPSDIPIVNFCDRVGAACYGGPLFDVAGRFKEVLRKYQFDGFVRITGDSPLLDSQLVDKGVDIFRQGHFEIVTNVLKRTYPAGQSVEVLNSAVFIDGYRQMESWDDKEHVTKFFYRNRDKFRICNFSLEKDCSKVHLAVDTQQDIEAVASIIRSMNRPHWQYGLQEILNIYYAHGKKFSSKN